MHTHTHTYNFPSSIICQPIALNFATADIECNFHLQLTRAFVMCKTCYFHSRLLLYLIRCANLSVCVWPDTSTQYDHFPTEISSNLHFDTAYYTFACSFYLVDSSREKRKKALSVRIKGQITSK